MQDGGTAGQDEQLPLLPPLKMRPALAAPARPSSELPARVQQRLAAEVLRKLRLAAEAERREDRDIICSEVFADVTGELNRAARGERRGRQEGGRPGMAGTRARRCRLRPRCHRATRPSPRTMTCPLAESAGLLYTRWYEALAPYFCRCCEASEALLAACRRLWGQPFTAPTYALLLHQWLLVHADAGGRDQRQKHLAVLVSGGGGGGGDGAAGAVGRACGARPGLCSRANALLGPCGVRHARPWQAHKPAAATRRRCRPAPTQAHASYSLATWRQHPPPSSHSTLLLQSRRDARMRVWMGLRVGKVGWCVCVWVGGWVGGGPCATGPAPRREPTCTWGKHLVALWPSVRPAHPRSVRRWCSRLTAAAWPQCPRLRASPSWR